MWAGSQRQPGSHQAGGAAAAAAAAAEHGAGDHDMTDATDYAAYSCTRSRGAGSGAILYNEAPSGYH